MTIFLLDNFLSYFPGNVDWLLMYNSVVDLVDLLMRRVLTDELDAVCAELGSYQLALYQGVP